MSKKREFKVSLVSPKIWQAELDRATETLAPREARFARAVVETMHNRHLGISPGLAADLAVAVLEPQKQAEAGVWGHVFARLQEELVADPSRSRNGGSRSRYGLVFNANPMYCVTRLAMPLVDRACRSMGACLLFCEEETDSDIDTTHYHAYTEALADTLIRLAASYEEGAGLFWQDTALTLAGFSRKIQNQAGGISPLPETDPTTLAMLLRLRTGKLDIRKRLQRRRLMTSASKHREMRNRKEGGIDGIQITRRAEDLDGILLSEFINPDIILADRIANTGFFAMQRQPKREKLRDVLLGALLPVTTARDLVSDFVKACWFESMLHLGLMLRRSGMNRSEFRWSEGSPYGGTRQSAFLLKDMPSFANIPDGPPSEALRREFITALGWLPAFLDTHQKSTQLPPNPEMLEQSDLEHLKHWAFSAWHAQKEHLKWRTDDTDRTGTNRRDPSHISVREYSFVHVLAFLPIGMRTPGHAADLGSFIAGLGLGRGGGHHVSIMWIPETVNPTDEWIFETRGGRGRSLFTPTDAEMGARDMAGRLVQAWMNQWIKEIWRG
ncbi:MAG: hypothetical protein QNK37_27930 [Acidobacteriota bacterium]|nr:hypothetical protein [Acidobacteriota bacterium]